MLQYTQLECMIELTDIRMVTMAFKSPELPQKMVFSMAILWGTLWED